MPKMPKKSFRLLLIPIVLILGGFGALFFEGVPGVVIPLLALIISTISFVILFSRYHNNKEKTIDSRLNKVLAIIPLELIASAILMLCGVFFGGFFGVSAYIFFFFACIPLLTLTLRKTLTLTEGEVRSSGIFFLTLTFWGAISGLLWTGFLFLFFDYSSSTLLALILLAFCAFPILYYLHRILPKQITRSALNLSFFPVGIITYFSFFVTYYLISFFWNTDDSGTKSLLYLLLFILYVFAPIFYVRNFSNQVKNSFHKFESFRKFCLNFILTSVFIITICMLLFLYYDIDPLDFPSCC